MDTHHLSTQAAGNLANVAHILPSFGATHCLHQQHSHTGFAVFLQMYTRCKRWRLHMQLSCHLLPHLCTKFTQDGRQSYRQTGFSTEGKLVPNTANSTNTANDVIVFDSNFKEGASSLQVCPNPAQPPCQLHTQQAATSKGHMKVKIIGFSQPPVADSHHRFHLASHLTARADNGVCLAVQQQLATAAFLPRCTHACTIVKRLGHQIC